MEREDNFRLKRFKELKTKKNKGDDDKRYPCYCDKKPGKGDDFICAVCKAEQDKNKSKKKTCEFKSSSCIAEVIGDKASTLITANQKRLDDLTTHLEKVISLTSQCKTEGLVSSSIDRLIYACREVRNKLEETCDKSNTTESATCSACEGENQVPPIMPCNTCSESIETETQQQAVDVQDSFGCFETKYKEIVKVKKFKNEDGTISEEKQVITVKTERKFPQNVNDLSSNTCNKIKAIDFSSHSGSKDDNCPCKKSKSENIENTVKSNQKNIRSCVSDTGDNRKTSPSKPECCKVFNASNNPKTPSVTSNEVCPKKCSSTNASIKSKVSRKPSKSSNKSSGKKSSKKSKKDEYSECRVEITSACCDSMWKDVACSTTGLAENSDEVEEFCICIKESDLVEPNKKVDKASTKRKPSRNKEDEVEELCICIKESDLVEPNKKLSKHSIMKKSSGNKVELCCEINETEIQSSLPRDIEVCCKSDSKDAKIKKDASATTSNIILEEFEEKSSHVKSQPCCTTENDLRKTDAAPKTCCKIKIIAKQKVGQENKDEKVKEIIFCGSILDAIKKLLSPNKSQENIKNTSNHLQTQENMPKSCSCTSKKVDFPSKKSSTKTSAKSSVCKTCETASKVPSDGIQSSIYGSCKSMEKSQSCPQCHAKNEEKSITWSHQRSKSEQNICPKCPKNVPSKPTCCACKSRKESVSKCSICGSTLSKSNATSLPSHNPSETDKNSCVSCNESYSSIWRNGTGSDTRLKDKAVACDECIRESESTVSKSTCKTCQTDRLVPKVQPKPSQKLSQSKHSCPICTNEEKSTTRSQQKSKSEQNTCPKCPKNVPSKPICCACKSRKESISKCSICGRTLSKSNATSLPSRNPSETNKNSCVSCNESYSSISRNGTGSETHLKDKAAACDACIRELESTVSKSTCKTCRADRPDRKVQPKPSQKLSQPHHSCPICTSEEKSTTKSQQKSKSEQNTCPKCPKNVPSKPICCACKSCKESKCSICGSTLSKSNATSLPSRNPSEADKNSCVSCNESYSSISRNGTGSEIRSKDKAVACDACIRELESKVSMSTCKTCQTDRPVPKVQPKPSQKLSQSHHSCPICIINQKTAQNEETKKHDERSSRPDTKVKSAQSLCCGCTSSSFKDDSGSKEKTPVCTVCTGEVEMVDASTSTRRSDRYDVRPLKMIMSNKQPTCTCHSDSYLIKRAPRNPKRSRSCSSCHGDYYR